MAIKRPKVSVIVPVYKVESYLMQCVDSILIQTLKDIEVILIDEGDRDACYAIMLYYAKTDKRVKIIHEKNGGYGASCNKGIKAARGEYISIVESDDFIEPRMLEDLYKKAKKLNADVIKCPYFLYRLDPRLKKAVWDDCSHRANFAKNAPSNTHKLSDFPQHLTVHPSIWAGLYRRNFVIRNRCYFTDGEGTDFSDSLFRIMTMALAKKIAWVDYPLYVRRVEATKISGPTKTFDLSQMLQLWKKIHDFFANHKQLYLRLAPYLIIEEYRCTFSRVYDPKMTDEDFQMMKRNLQWTPLECLAASPYLQPWEFNRLKTMRGAKTFEHFRESSTIKRVFRRLWRTSGMEARFYK